MVHQGKSYYSFSIIQVLSICWNCYKPTIFNQFFYWYAHSSDFHYISTASCNSNNLLYISVTITWKSTMTFFLRCLSSREKGSGLPHGWACFLYDERWYEETKQYVSVISLLSDWGESPSWHEDLGYIYHSTPHLQHHANITTTLDAIACVSSTFHSATAFRYL